MPSSSSAQDDVDMAVPVEDAPSTISPPARVAARFYRNSNANARRKSSAQSSRRSSLSSAHSRTSNLSCHGGPHSTHIAQHLRRASIIESRKARLADRAAHAEQVRLRAAAVKASQRATYSEEKALAAQAAREKLLAEITARCEEEVRRAKKIAEETREKKAAEHARLREELADKYADAAKRRSLYQSTIRRPRTASLAAVEETKINPIALKRMSHVAAAKTIQRAWRRYLARHIFADFTSLKLSLDHVGNLSFEQLTILLAEDKTVRTTRKLLSLIGLADGVAAETSDRNSVKIFLSAYMILAHPVQALSHGGNDPREQELMTKAKILLSAFDTYVRTVTVKDPALVDLNISRETLQFAYNDYSSAFDSWKSQDLDVLIDVMVNSFVNLDLIIQATKDDRDGMVADDYLQAVRQEQVKLLARLKRLAGPEQALTKVRTAVRKARKQRAAKQRPVMEHVPRATTPANGSMDIQVPITPPATPRPQRSRPQDVPMSFLARLGQTMTVLPTNREIAHEMQIYGTYEVQQQPWADARERFITTLRSSMRESMQSGGSQAAASWTHAMAVLIREKLLNLISSRHPLYDRIDGYLDLKLIDQQCRNGMFSYPDFFDTIATLIAQLCSPGRDEAVQAFASDKTSDTIDRLFVLINIVDLMTLDHINFQFRMAARSVIEHGHEHEHVMFEKDQQNSVYTLSHTKRWWRGARSTLPTANTNGKTIYARGLVDLVFQNSHFTFDQVPETLRLDYIRLLNMRAKALHMVAVSSILLTTKIRLRRNREALWTKDAERLMALDLTTTDPSRILSLIESSHMMPESVREGLLNFINRVLPPAAAAAKNASHAQQDRLLATQTQPDFNPCSPSPSFGSEEESEESTGRTNDSADFFTEQVATYVLKSLREHVFARLSTNSTAEKVRATTSAAEVLARAGMPEFVSDVGTMVDLLEKVRTIDIKAHSRWYDTVASEIAAEGTGVSTA